MPVLAKKCSESSTVVRMGVSYEVNGGDNFETVANRFVSVSVVETVMNGLGFFLSETLGFLLIGDGFISSYRRRRSEPSRMGWVSSYWRRLGFFSSATVSFGIGDAWLSSHWRRFLFISDTWVPIVTLGSVSSGDGLVESESDLFGSIFFVWVLFF